MSEMMSLNEVKITPFNPLQKTFNRLKKKVFTLRSRLKDTEVLLEQAHDFFQKEISPLDEALLRINSDLIKALYKYYKKSKHFSGTDKVTLKEWIIKKCYDIFEMADSANDIDVELQNILKDLDGVDYQDLFNEHVEEGKAIMSEMFKKFNLNVDLSSIDATDNPDSIVRKLLEAMLEAHEGQQPEFPTHTKAKSKKQIQKEIKAQELERLQQDGLKSLYKQLAKALHPDLEQDPDVKAEKEELMKRLTTAYKNEDLHTLLSIEMEWFNRTEFDARKGKLQSDEQLKIFNSLLKNQVEELEIAIKMAPSNPRFLFLDRIHYNNVKNIVNQLRRLRNDLKSEIHDLKNIEQDLTSPFGAIYLRSIMRAYS